jgi:hypothetical protein
MKFYIRLDETTWRQCIEQVVASFLADHPVAAAGDSIRQRLARLRFPDFEFIVTDDSAVYYEVAMVTRFHRGGAKHAYEVVFRMPLTDSPSTLFERRVKSLIAAVPALLYGYGRVLEGNVSPSEIEVRRTIFGGTRIKIERIEDVWMQAPASIFEGAMKGVYTLNVVQDAKLGEATVSELLKAGRARPVKGSSLCIVEYDAETLPQLRRAHRTLAKYIRD